MMNNMTRSKGRKKIFPIFFEVEPGDVKHWNPCLEEVGKIKGWKVDERQSQSEIVDEVVQRVLEVLGRKEESQTERPTESDDSMQSSDGSSNCPSMWAFGGRESESRKRTRSGRSEELIREVKTMEYTEVKTSAGRVRKFKVCGYQEWKGTRTSVGKEGEERRTTEESPRRRGRSVVQEREEVRKHECMQEEHSRRGTSEGSTRGMSVGRKRERRSVV